MTPLGKRQDESSEEHNIILIAPSLHKDTQPRTERSRSSRGLQPVAKRNYNPLLVRLFCSFSNTPSLRRTLCPSVPLSMNVRSPFATA